MDNLFLNHKLQISPEKQSKSYIKDKLKTHPPQNVYQSDVKKLGTPSITFSLTTTLPHSVYSKYKLLYPKDYIFDLTEALKESGKGLFSNLLSNNYKIPNFEKMWEEQYKSTTIPDKGLIVPDTTEKHFQQLTGNDTSLFLDFVNISDTDDMLAWVSKYGPLNDYYSEKYSGAQDIERFINELTILKTLYYLFAATNTYAEGNKDPLKSRIKIIKVATFAEMLESRLETTLLSTLTFWGHDYSIRGNFQLDKLQIDKLKKKTGYILLLDEIPTRTYFEQEVLTDDTLPIKVIEFIAQMIDYKTCFESENGSSTSKYSISSIGVQNNTQNAPSTYRLIPSISCHSKLELMYFQFLWLISTNGAKPCKKCGQYFLPQGDRPGKQKYCGHCGKHAAQDQYKKRTLAAIKAYKSGTSLEQAAIENKITIKRLSKALEAGV